MIYVFRLLDRPDGAELRQRVRPEHKAYLAQVADRIAFAGPLTHDDGVTMIGSLLAIDFDSRQAARDWPGVCAAEIRPRVGPGWAPRQGAARSPGWTPGQAVQHRMGAQPGPTRRAGAIRGAGRCCALVAGVDPAPRARLARHRDLPRREAGSLPRRLLAGEPFTRAGLYTSVDVHAFVNLWPQKAGFAPAG